MQSPQYVWQRLGWPKLTFDTARVAQEVALARRAQLLGVLKQVGGGRSTRYYINLPGWVPETA